MAPLPQRKFPNAKRRSNERATGKNALRESNIPLRQRGHDLQGGIKGGIKEGTAETMKRNPEGMAENSPAFQRREPVGEA